MQSTTCAKIHIVGVLEGEEREKGGERVFEESLAKNSPDLVENINLHI